MLDNRTPFQAERTWVRDREGVHHWIVVVKATYDVGADGALALSETPVAPLHAPEYIGEDGASSLRYEADLVAMKPATDVYLNAVAYAPGGRPCTELRAGFTLGPLRKVLTVHGPRTWMASLAAGATPSPSEPFTATPIVYEHAYGGSEQDDPDPRKHRIDLRNPVGTGVAAHPDNLVGKPAPSIEDPSGSPAGFGAIGGWWTPRRELAGTYDERWEAERKPLLPEDWDPRCLLCAPADQQVPGYLRGGEVLELANLTPGGWLRSALPSVSLAFESWFGSERREHRAELVTVVAESEGPRLILAWQTSLRCGRDADYLDRTVIRHQERAS